MHPDLQRYLDGELPLEALAPELAAEAREWDRLLAGTGEIARERAPDWLEARVMATLPPAPLEPAWRRAWRWLVEPRTVRLRPAAVVLAGGLAAFVLLLWNPAGPMAPPDPFAMENGAAVVYVQFVLAADEASSVAVAGDFNGWDPAAHALRDVNGDGVWTGLFQLSPGMHKYMFVVDGDRWVTDPRAERYVDDGFGMRNAVIAVVPPQWAS